MQKVTKAVIPAAGFGTRFLPQTKAMPKEMLPVVDKPIIQYVVEECVASGIEDIILVTGYHKRTIEDHFDVPSTDLIENLKLGGEKKKPLLDEIMRIGDMANFIYIRQKGSYGNATPVKNAQHIIGDEPFAVMWGDEFIYSEEKPRLKQCLEVFEEFGDPVISGVKIEKKEDLSRYGIADLTLVRDNIYVINRIIEKPKPEEAPSQIATHGCYVLTPDIFEVLNSQKPGTGGEYYLPEAIDELRARGRKIYACEIVGGKYYDTGNKIEYLKTVVEFALKHPEINGEFREYLKGLEL
ncbi:UTP--glucose-1-phosphate uridylyltransferase [Microgenomates group bacterium RBG_16_45_19]|nr:MAG: UTP--glucose-1-phosphate uridylyltransferase [Microgenomates group bacterium RBG_16_45_19]